MRTASGSTRARRASSPRRCRRASRTSRRSPARFRSAPATSRSTSPPPTATRWRSARCCASREPPAAASYRISGIVRFAGSTSFGGAGVALLTLPQAQRIAGETGAFDTLIVGAQPSVSDATLRDRIRAVLPRTLDVRTGAQQAAQQTSDLESQLGFLRTFLLIFAYVALFVGAFIIFNTFSITVAQRTREFGLLRTMGATRAQLLGSVARRGPAARTRRRRRSDLRPASRSPPASTSCSRPSAPTCPTAAPCSSSGRSGSRCSPAPR